MPSLLLKLTALDVKVVHNNVVAVVTMQNEPSKESKLQLCLIRKISQLSTTN